MEAQIMVALKQAEAGRTMDDVARDCGVSQARIYTWKSKFGGMNVREAPAFAFAGGRELAPEAAGGRSQSGQGDAEGGDRKKTA